MPKKRLVIFCTVRQFAYWFFRDHQDMYRSLGIDIPEGKAQIILVYDFSRNLPVYYFAEQGICHDCCLILDCDPGREAAAHYKASLLQINWIKGGMEPAVKQESCLDLFSVSLVAM